MKRIASGLWTALLLWMSAVTAFAAVATPERAAGLWLQNARLKNDYAKLSASYNSLKDTAYQDLSEAVSEYEAAAAKKPEYPPIFSEAELPSPPTITGLFQRVRFVVQDKQGQPVTNIHIKTEGTTDALKEKMSGFSDPGFDITTDHNGQTLRYLMSGSYSLTLSCKVAGEEVHETYTITVEAGSATVLTFPLTWESETPRERYQKLENKLVFRVRDKNKEPVTALLAKVYLSEPTGNPVDALVVEQPIEHLDAQGLYTLPMPESDTIKLLLFSDNNRNNANGVGYAQTVEIRLSKKTGVQLAEVLWSPQEAEINTTVKFLNPKVPSFQGIETDALQKQIDTLLADNQKLMTSISETVVKWNALTEDVRQQEKTQKARVSALYGLS